MTGQTTADGAVVDLFAGPGGWDEGARSLGVHAKGIEWDATACETARAAGHFRLQADIAKLDPRATAAQLGPVRGLIASPPCQGFSAAGKGKGRRDALLLLQEIRKARTAADVERSIAFLTEHMTDHRSVLVLEPLRWAMALTPSWLAWEQVPAVLPIWEACARALRRLGYTVAVGKLSSEQYGVAQTRQRAILVARAPWATRLLGPARLPEPTHSRYYGRDPQRLDLGVLPWVSMAEALGWCENGEQVETNNDSRQAGGLTKRFTRPTSSPSPTVTSGAKSWKLRSNYGTGGDPKARGERLATQPAPTVTTKVDRNKWVMCAAGATSPQTEGTVPRIPHEAPSATITGKGTAAWVYERPATTVQGDPRIGRPGHKHRGPDCCTANAEAGVEESQFATGAVRVTVEEAAQLQSFPADYPWQGTKGKQYEQIGNAVPPLLAQAVVAEVAGLAVAADVEASQ